MSSRNLILAALVCLAAIVIMIRGQAPAEKERIHLEIPAIASFDKVEIERFGLDPIKIVKKADQWFVEPGLNPVSNHVSKLLNSTFAQPIESDYGVELTGVDPRTFSVTKAATTVNLSANDETILRFRMGKLVGGKQTFVRPLGSGHVFRMNANLRQLFDRQPIDWRERRMVGLQANDIQALSASGRGFEDWSISRTSPDREWVMNRPRSFLVSQETANATANVVSTVRAAAFHDSTKLPIQSTIELTTFDEKNLVLELGPVDEHGARLARLNAGQVFLIPRHQAMFMTPGIDALRNRRLFRFTANEAVELIFSGPPRIHLRKQNDGSWSMIAPESHRRLSNLVMESALSQISLLETVGFPPRTSKNPMDPIYAELTIKLVDDREVTVSIGRPFNQSGARYAESTARPEMLYVIGPGAIKAIQPAVSDLTLNKN